MLDFATLKMGNRARFCELVLSKKGALYRWGARGPDRFDCSGLVVWGLVMAGGPEWRSGWWTQRLFDELPPMLTPRVGDLAFYGSSVAEISHVMIYMGTENSGRRVYGASGGNKMTTSDEVAIYRKAFVKMKPDVNYRPDFQGWRAMPLE